MGALFGGGPSLPKVEPEKTAAEIEAETLDQLRKRQQAERLRRGSRTLRVDESQPSTGLVVPSQIP